MSGGDNSTSSTTRVTTCASDGSLKSRNAVISSQDSSEQADTAPGRSRRRWFPWVVFAILPIAVLLFAYSEIAHHVWFQRLTGKLKALGEDDQILYGFMAATGAKQFANAPPTSVAVDQSRFREHSAFAKNRATLSKYKFEFLLSQSASEWMVVARAERATSLRCYYGGSYYAVEEQISEGTDFETLKRRLPPRPLFP